MDPRVNTGEENPPSTPPGIKPVTWWSGVWRYTTQLKISPTPPSAFSLVSGNCVKSSSPKRATKWKTTQDGFWGHVRLTISTVALSWPGLRWIMIDCSTCGTKILVTDNSLWCFESRPLGTTDLGWSVPLGSNTKTPLTHNLDITCTCALMKQSTHLS